MGGEVLHLNKAFESVKAMQEAIWNKTNTNIVRLSTMTLVFTRQIHRQ